MTVTCRARVPFRTDICTLIVPTYHYTVQSLITDNSGGRADQQHPSRAKSIMPVFSRLFSAFLSGRQRNISLEHPPCVVLCGLSVCTPYFADHSKDLNQLLNARYSSDTTVFCDGAHGEVHDKGHHAPHRRDIDDGLERTEATALTVRDVMRRQKEIRQHYLARISFRCTRRGMGK